MNGNETEINTTSQSESEKVLDKIYTFLTNHSKIIYIIIASLIIGTVIWFIYILNQLKHINEPETFIHNGDSTIEPSDINDDELFGNIQIIGSYNSCANKDLTKVSISNLETIIQAGIRYLDFEVFSHNNKTVVSVSKKSEYVENSDTIGISKVLEICKTAMNSSMPLFLQFRIKNNYKNVCDEIADAINKHFNERQFIRKKYDADNNRIYETNILNKPFSFFKNKVVIIVYEYENNNTFKNTRLMHFTDIHITTSKKQPYILKQSEDLKINSNIDIDFTETTKEMFTIVIPSWIENYDIEVPLKTGYHVMLLNIQNNDTFLQGITKTHKQVFIVKKGDIRIKRINVEKPIESEQGLLCPNKKTVNIMGQKMIVSDRQSDICN